MIIIKVRQLPDGKRELVDSSGRSLYRLGKDGKLSAVRGTRHKGNLQPSKKRGARWLEVVDAGRVVGYVDAKAPFQR